MGRAHFYSVEPSQLIPFIHSCTPFRVKDYKLLLEGWDNVVLLANGSHVFRFTRRPDVAEQLKKEAQLLPTLSKRLTLRVPVPEYTCMSGPLPHFMGYRLIPGEQLKASCLNHPNSSKIASSLALFLTQLQGVPLGEAGDLLPMYTGTDWRDLHLVLREEAQRLVAPKLPPRAASGLLWDLDGYLEDPENFSFRPHLIHRDLSSDHILHDPAMGCLTGVIDWGDACAGDPAFDLTGLLADYGPAFASAVAEAKGDPPEYLGRAGFYARIVGVHTVLYGLDVGEDAHVEVGLRRLEAAYK